MTAQRFSKIELFVRRAHRRRVIWRALEHAGIGAACASLVGAAMVLPMAVLGIAGSAAPIVPTVVLIACGAACGMAVERRRRPALLDTAMLIDRQLNLPELISSAFLHSVARRDLPRGTTDGAFEAIVLTMADDCTRGRPASTLVLHRLGPRAWGSIGLAAALALSAAALLSAPRQPSALAVDSGLGPEVAHEARTSEMFENPTLRERGAPTRMRENRVAKGPDSLLHPESADLRRLSPDANRTEVAAVPSNHGTNDANADSDGAGAGRVTTDRPGASKRVDLPAAILERSALSGGSLAVTASTGARAPRSDEPSGVQPIDGIVAGKDPAARPPVWTTDTWPAARRAALGACDSADARGSIPSAYRDLVRDYFNR